MFRWTCLINILLCIVYLEIRTIHAAAKYTCYKKGENVSCTDMQTESLRGHLSITLGEEDANSIQELTIGNSTIPILEGRTFASFHSLQKLHLRNTKTRYIVEGAFSNMPNLSILSVTDNYLKAINFNAFAADNLLHTLDVSRNLLRDLSSFDIGAFPSLAVMNVSHNMLEYLPDNVVSKLREVNSFYLVVDNNPWNCTHPMWAGLLTGQLIDAFCTDNSYDPTEMDRKTQNLENLLYDSPGKESPGCNVGRSFARCVWWIFGALWAGIIVGNICKLKKLLFTAPRSYVDKNTQCDKFDLLPKA